MKQWFVLKSFGINYEQSKALVISLLSLILLTSVLTPLNVTFSRSIAENAAALSENSGVYVKALWAIGMFTLLAICEPILDKLIHLLQKRMRQKTTVFIKNRLSQKLLDMEYGCFDNSLTYDICARTLADADDAIPNTVIEFIKLLKNILSAFMLVLIIVKIKWWVLPFSLLAFIPMILLKIKREDDLYNARKQYSILERKANYISSIMFDKNSVMEVRLFDLSGHLKNKWYTSINEVFKLSNDINLKTAKKGFIINFLHGCGGSPVTFIIILFVIYGNMGLSDYIALTLAMDSLTMLMTIHIVNNVSHLRKYSNFWRDYEQFSLLEERCESEATQELAMNEITFENVYFSYPKSAKSVLNGISFKIHKGEKLVLAGANGSGKSTIIKLLLGLYKPDSGYVKINGIDVYGIAATQRAKLMTAVFQDYTKYNLTIRENIALANLSFISDNGKIVAAAEKGRVNAFISELSDKYETLLGNVFGGGSDLSEGQWQRLSISRAFMSDAQIMALDEPTAALDPRSEEEIYHSFIELARDKTCILVSHRLASAKVGDRILVVSEGRIAEDGCHSSLIAAGGLYSKMFTAQAEWFSEGESI